jgi:cytochrome c-type biogenesis protein CcmH
VRGRLAFLSWVGLVLAVAAGLWLGSSRPAAAPTLSQRTEAIAAQIRCPSCEDLTAAESNSQTAVAVRELIRSDLAKGQSQAQIESYLVARYGSDIILRPSGRGLSALVWLVPLVAASAGLGGAVIGLLRWRRRPGGPSQEDRLLVEAALREGSA